jgi:hypothetical protein
MQVAEWGPTASEGKFASDFQISQWISRKLTNIATRTRIQSF